MNWFKKSFWSYFCYKRAYSYGYFSNEIRLNQPRYFSCFSNSHKSLLLPIKFNRLEVQKFSIIVMMKSAQLTLSKFLKKFSRNWLAYIPIYGNIKYKNDGFIWFKSLDGINIEEFINLFSMPDTFFSRFNIIELHTWMLLFNLPKEGRINTIIRRGLIEAMWVDAEARGKLIDRANPNFKKDFTRLNNKFQVSLFLYDNGYCTDDVNLSTALWYNFFDKSNVDPRVLEALVEYVRYQMENLSKLDYDELEKQEFKEGIWKSPRPFVKHLKD